MSASSNNVAVTDPGWTRLTDTLVASLASLEKATGSIRRTTKRVTSDKDIQEAKAKVEDIITDAGSEINQIHNVLQLVEKYVTLHVSVRMQASKVVSDSRVHLDRFQIACDAFEQRCQSIERNASTVRANKRYGSTNNRYDDDSEKNEDEELLPTSETRRKQQLLQKQQEPTQRQLFEQRMHEETLGDRSKEVKEILDNVQDINEIFTHINELVGEQGEKLDTVAVNVESAEEKTRKGVENLREAAKHHRRNRFIQFSVVFIIIVFVAVVLAVMTA